MIRSVNQPDVVVVGAGPAGLSAAIQLARAGRSVTVCESCWFPRRKVCGGCLSGDAVELLGNLLGDTTATLGTTVTRITFGIGGRSFAASAGERCRIIPRDVLDATLAERAEEAGATLRFGVRAELTTQGTKAPLSGVESHEGTQGQEFGVAQALESLRIGEEVAGRFGVRCAHEDLRPQWVIWAAGLGGLVRQGGRAANGTRNPSPRRKPGDTKEVAAAATPPMPPMPHAQNGQRHRSQRRELIGQAWSVAPTDACPPVGEVAMHWLRGGYVGLATVSDEECLIATAIEKGPSNRFGRSGHSDGSGPWRSLRTANPNATILEVMDLPALGPKLGTAGFPHRPRRVGSGNLLFAGDAAGFEEPFSGEGIGQAMRSGLAAADALLSAQSDEAVVSNYRRSLRMHRRVRRRTRWMSHVLRCGPVFALADSPLFKLDGLGQRLLKSVHIKAVAKGG